MVTFFPNPNSGYFGILHRKRFSNEHLEKLSWLFDESKQDIRNFIPGDFIGPRKELVSPWSTNAVEICHSMRIPGIIRIEAFTPAGGKGDSYDPMLEQIFNNLDQNIFEADKQPSQTFEVDDIEYFNQEEGLALSQEEVTYLQELSQRLGRLLTDSEVFGFSQVNSEHCRHKIFNGRFVIDGKPKDKSLFQLIKATSLAQGQNLVSAYKDNVAFIKGPKVKQFAPSVQERPDYFQNTEFESVLSLKAETHNFPTTVEPFYGASTGSGGEIRDRLAGGKASLPLAGTAVYMTSYPALGRPWEKGKSREWLYQTPLEILIKASNGASDFGNKFGQPLICGSLLTYEWQGEQLFGYDKVIMLAGGVGFGKLESSHKGEPSEGDQIVVLGGDNYRIGMGGGAVSSVATGEYNNVIELNAVQRANPEMQKRVANTIRALFEAAENPIISIHDHGAGGHLNCLSELVEEIGGKIIIDQLPIGDNTLSDKEIIGNESQERMGLILKKDHIDLISKIAKRERTPFYVVGETTGDHHLVFVNQAKGEAPIDLDLDHLFGSSPSTEIRDDTIARDVPPLAYDPGNFEEYLESVLQIEAVACKDWLTNKVDRSVTGKVALQQTVGPIQLPLNNLGIMALDYETSRGVATSIGHAPGTALIDPTAGSRLAITRALTNLVWANLAEFDGISLSANWMWPANNPGEDSRLYQAVEGLSEFAISLGINVPTGKDSLSMTQRYPGDKTVLSPGTVIVSTVAEVLDVRKRITPCLSDQPGSQLIYIDFSQSDKQLGGSSFSQILSGLGDKCPTIDSPEVVRSKFEAIQQLIQEEMILAGHDIGAGGLITTLLEMTFTRSNIGLDLDLSELREFDPVQLLFSENPGIVIQVNRTEEVEKCLLSRKVDYQIIGTTTTGREIAIRIGDQSINLSIPHLRDIWYQTSAALDSHQTSNGHSEARFKNYKEQELHFTFDQNFKGSLNSFGIDRAGHSHGVKAAIIREKGVNGDREMAYSMYLAGFDVKDVHMTDLVSGREELDDLNFIVFVGGFSNSDVLGSAKGWAGSFLYNDKARKSLDRFYSRADTLSLGVCNGCQLMVALDLLYPEHNQKAKLRHNRSEKFESAFLNVDIPVNQSIMLGSLAGSRLGVWVAHGEGRFELPYPEDHYQVAAKYSYDQYPGNPNGSSYSVAAITSADGRHLAMMPHLERSIFSWQWAHYPEQRKSDHVTPWFEAFVNAREWIKENR